MRKVLAATTLGTMTAALLAAVALLALWAPRAGPDTARANHLVTIGLDLDPSATPANTATSLGSIQNCRDVSVGGFFTFDVYITDVGTEGGSQSLLAFAIPIQYDGAVMKITAVDVLQFLNAGAGSDVLNASDPIPPGGDTDGLYEAGAADSGTNDDRGTGVLARVTGQAVLTGVSAMTIAKLDRNGDTVLDVGPFLQAGNVTPIGDTTIPPDTFFDGPASGGTVAVNQLDSDGDGKSDICDPDIDNDGIPNSSDNCPSVANPGQQNLDGDIYGDACDNDIDGEGFPNARETATGANPTNALSIVEVCDGLDNDADTLVDEDALDHDGDTQINDPGPDADGDTIKDCLDTNTDTDGDTVPNSSDTNDDDDGNPDPDFNDGALDTRENWMGIDSLDYCADNSNDWTWFVDINNDKKSNIGDVIGFKPVILTNYGQPAYDRRFDFNADRKINIGDVLGYAGYILITCPNP